MAKQWSKATTEANERSLKQRNYLELIETQYLRISEGTETMFPTSAESRAPPAAGMKIEDGKASQ
eukprot:12409146-Karenia_brevis.AAC.1